MIIRPKDHIYWEPIFETQQEAQAFKDYWEQIFTQGFVERAGYQAVFSCPNSDTVTGRRPSKKWLLQD